MSLRQGLVLWGANNIFSLRSEEGIFEARIKGKKLEGTEGSYNPLAPGDRVEFEVTATPAESPAAGTGNAETGNNDSPRRQGMILSRLERNNEFGRWNKKKQGMQTIAANIDELCILSSPVSPPFRPRFIDRALALGEYNGLKMRIIINKTDQGIDELLAERMEYYRSIGYELSGVSVHRDEGISELVEQWHGKTIVLLGQSGVGKSSLVKRIFPDERIRTAEVSSKFNRGRHTTVLARSYELGEDGLVIDTPGIRELDLYGIPPQDLSFLFVEFPAFAEHCALNGCLHVHEPDCAVKDAVVDGKILEDRYDSYINTLIVMEQSARQMNDWKFRKL